MSCGVRGGFCRVWLCIVQDVWGQLNFLMATPGSRLGPGICNHPSLVLLSLLSLMMSGGGCKDVEASDCYVQFVRPSKTTRN